MLSSTLSVMWDIFLVIVLGIGIIAGASVVTAILAVVWVNVTRFVHSYRKASAELAQIEAEEKTNELDPYGKLQD